MSKRVLVSGFHNHFRIVYVIEFSVLSFYVRLTLLGEISLVHLKMISFVSLIKANTVLCFYQGKKQMVASNKFDRFLKNLFSLNGFLNWLCKSKIFLKAFVS